MSAMARLLGLATRAFSALAFFGRFMTRSDTATGRTSAGAGCLLAVTLAGCASPPADYAAALSNQDPKWQTPQCQQIRAAALDYTAGERRVSWAGGLLLGPYGLGLAAAGKEHQAKQRKLFAREIHMRCSSQPLPKELQINP